MELLIGLGIVGIIASVVIVAVSPRSAIVAARDAERSLVSSQLHSAMIQYQLAQGNLPNAAGIGNGSTNAKQLCAEGVTTNTNCVNVDGLVPDFVTELPQDIAEPCADYTGYTVYRDGGLVVVTAIHRGKLPGDADITVTAGCSSGGSGGGGTSSSTSSAAMSAAVSSVTVSSIGVSSTPASSVAASSIGISSEPASSAAVSSIPMSSATSVSTSMSSISIGFGY